MKINCFDDLHAFIQTNAPMFLTDDLTLYAIVGKVVWYTNSLNRRMNELAHILADLSTKTNEELKRLNTELEKFKTDITTSFNNFKSEINTDLANFKNKITSEYNTFTSEQLIRLDNLTSQVETSLEDFKRETINTVDSFKNSITIDLANFKTQTETNYNNNISELQQKYTNDFTSLNSELTSVVDNKLTELEQNIDSVVSTKVDNILTTQTVQDIFESLYGIYYNLSDYRTTKPTNQDKMGVGALIYASDENLLYISTSNGVWKETTLNSKGLYYFDGSYYSVQNKQLRKIGDK